MNNELRVYISLPITGRNKEYQKKLAHDAAMWLEARGMTAVNPFDNGVPEGEERQVHMAKDFEILLGCDAIMPVGHWEMSPGCRAEMLVAQETCKTVILSPNWAKFRQLVEVKPVSEKGQYV